MASSKKTIKNICEHFYVGLLTLWLDKVVCERNLYYKQYASILKRTKHKTVSFAFIFIK